jgi:hypothetical protein
MAIPYFVLENRPNMKRLIVVIVGVLIAATAGFAKDKRVYDRSATMFWHPLQHDAESHLTFNDGSRVSVYCDYSGNSAECSTGPTSFYSVDFGNGIVWPCCTLANRDEFDGLLAVQSRMAHDMLEQKRTGKDYDGATLSPAGGSHTSAAQGSPFRLPGGNEGTAYRVLRPV